MTSTHTIVTALAVVAISLCSAAQAATTVAGRPREKSGLISLPLVKRRLSKHPRAAGAPGRGERVIADAGGGRAAETR